MSNLDPAPEAVNLTPGVVQAVDVIEGRKAAIGDGTEVRRLLPQRTLRTIGAWCFLDHYGPEEVSRGPGMQVPPHPHIGLQTVSWLFQGLVLHRDSVGSRHLIRPGELNLMTTSCCRSGRISSTGWSRSTAPPWWRARSSRPGCSRTCRPACPGSACRRPAGAGWPGSSWSAACRSASAC